ncbi:MAG: SUMF1/EgtB/PvdO family nonheme iron enzyme, partial [Thermoguttaceae bacterium]|nr:SUMF1/EgtB/PvdO family nonheme iron enzyme [Thermoguttaceae bacterium]
LWELEIDPNDPEKIASPKKISTIEENDVDNYDACYLPDDRIVFCSTACFTGVPCTNGAGHICNLYQRKTDGSVRQLTVEQDHDWCPTVMNNGRIMYLRWEYTDLPHPYARIMFHCNPDGSNQTELYGSGSWWPLAMFYARPIPNDPTKFVAITTGHHEVERIGDLVLFDPALGRQETEGAIQRIPGWGKKVNSVPMDYPIRRNWPKFVHPFPLSDKYFIVSCKRTPKSSWELCLVDVFDNIVTLREEPDVALFEPVPLRKTQRQPVLPDRISPPNADADVFIADIYEGEGLKGVPRGTVKSLRIFSYHFSYQGMGGEPFSIGLDGPWDPKRLIGTVPVCADGSVSFKIPANVPVSFQPLDSEGKAVQLMRSWVTAMPGESLSCVGCHEKQNTTSPPTARTIAAQKPPVRVTPFLGPSRGLSFQYEIQPILDYYCVECHQPNSAKTKEIFAKNDKYKNAAVLPDVPDFRDGPIHPVGTGKSRHIACARFTDAYFNLRKFVHTPTKESPITVLKPYQYHADSTRLIQVLQAGHYGVKLDTASWDRLVTWIDVNAPFHANWGDLRNYEMAQHVETQWQRRNDMRKLYTNNATEQDESPLAKHRKYPVVPSSTPDARNFIFRDIPDPPITAKEAKTFTKAEVESIQLVPGIELKLVSIPGTNFRLGQFEITNAQYKLFDPKHHSAKEISDVCCFSPREMGFPLYRANQPVCRVSWNDAMAFCNWLSQKTGRKFTLPTASQWQYAASGGTKTPYWFGEPGVDFSTFENFADLNLRRVASPDEHGESMHFVRWRPGDEEHNDRCRVSAPVGSYLPNPWKLYDMLGNVAEWTSSQAIGEKDDIKKIVCGGSWYTPPKEATMDARRRFRAHVSVFDTGFRVCEPDAVK